MSRKKYERGISYDTQRRLYYLYLDLGRDSNGIRQRRYLTFSTLLEARQARNAYLSQRSKLKQVPPTRLTLNQWLNRWMEEIVIPNRAETTAYGYQKIIENHISPALGNIPIQDLSPKDIQTYYATLIRRKHLSANTVRRHHDLLSAALHAALRLDLVGLCATDRVEPPRVIPKETNFYTSENLKLLYQLMEGHPLEVAVHLAGSLGLRREEICGLRWESIDFNLRKIHIKAARTTAGAHIVEKETKNRSSTRVLHMGDDIYHILRRERRRQWEQKLALGPAWPDSDLVAVDTRGKPFSPNLLSAGFSSFVRSHKDQLPPLTLHGLRHTFATVACAQGAPLFEIAKALGHSTPSTTGRIYTHLVDNLHTSTLDKVAAALR